MYHAVYLGSSSRWRKTVLDNESLDVRIVIPDVNEKEIRSDNPDDLVIKLANAKADALSSRIPDGAVLITADQVVTCNGRILEKPDGPDQAREFLKNYAFHPAVTVSALVVTRSPRLRFQGIERAFIHFTSMSDHTVEELIAIPEIYSCAGGFIIEHPKFHPSINSIDGSIDSVQGMPLMLLKNLLRNLIIEAPDLNLTPAWQKFVT